MRTLIRHEQFAKSYKISHLVCILSSRSKTHKQSNMGTIPRQANMKQQHLSLTPVLEQSQRFEYNSIQQSISILRKLIPEVLTDELVNLIYQRTAAIISQQPTHINNQPPNLNDVNIPIKRQDEEGKNSTRVNQLKQESRDKDSKYELHRRWAPAYQELLIELYKRTPNISRIRDRFQLVYREESPMFTVEAIRSKLFKILRAAIKKIQQMAKEAGPSQFPPLIKLNDNRVKTIINNHQFRKVRLLVLQAYSRGFEPRILNETINKINLIVPELETHPRTIRPQIENDNSYASMVPPFYHPFHNLKERARQIRLKYNRTYVPARKKDGVFIRESGPDSQQEIPEKHYDNDQVCRLGKYS